MVGVIQPVNFSNMKCNVPELKGDNYKIKISAAIRGSVEHYSNVRELLKAIDDQFVTSDKALASTLIMQFSSIKLIGIRGVRDHIIRMRDIAAQLKALEVEMSITFLVHYILCTRP
ncbi:hypothetical protein FEM48_Zijuj03G0087800 [Ziziphus jujuba var. spinosa]|uniref:Uncharacterized protein n=1 Tax=Ziziphus jujuba var. spinosa TaxID=714518 RepID=A0A978VPB9_ZIZJJ|nr:hypothetical protein FEM48_Zijuj03G0087800 [Ziziphus jujuba var. spinosa]